ncbi:hypothetical protein DCS_01325 [Drechmeria coniospora]|uniref:Uncharacterized protein n=1 Tax=Drechmeria coniospora TaxID=98403 RepID=A0A151GSZ3_DRECN|nr:hypothetical protein DCS_01325 [Drechmeria coniospora]KYK60190.1 hypothetical protein DCS_01325 [Drechmeria coniospora]
MFLGTEIAADRRKPIHAHPPTPRTVLPGRSDDNRERIPVPRRGVCRSSTPLLRECSQFPRNDEQIKHGCLLVNKTPSLIAVPPCRSQSSVPYGLALRLTLVERNPFLGSMGTAGMPSMTECLICESRICAIPWDSQEEMAPLPGGTLARPRESGEPTTPDHDHHVVTFEARLNGRRGE